MSKLSEILANLMMACGKYSEYELARCTGVSQSTINRIVSGEVEMPTYESLKKLSNFFKLSPEQLLGNEPIQKVNIFIDHVEFKLQEILQRLMDISNVTEQELSDHTGVAQSTINRILNGQTGNPRGVSLRPIADFFEVTVSQLIGTEPIDFLKISDNSLLEKVGLKKVAVIPFDRISNLGKFSDTKVNYPNQEMVLVETKESDRVFATLIVDNSMQPEFDAGTIVIVNQSIKPSDGSYVLIRIQNQLLIRELSVVGKKTYAQINQKSKSLQAINSEEILGVIIESRKSFIRE